MKIVTLNTWGGRAGKESLLSFLKKESVDTDVFCFQEIWSAPYEHLEGSPAGGLAINHDDIMVYGKQEITELLNEFEFFFHPHHLENYGLLMLVRKGVTVRGSGDIFVHEHRDFKPMDDVGKHARNVQYVTIEHNGGVLTVCNFHGLWNGKGKGDAPERIIQSQNIIGFLKGLQGEVILCGDFNLLPDTESLQMIEQAGYRNLVREFGITSTRTSLYTKPEKYADYIFVSQGIVVDDFKILPEEVSDHAPLALMIH